ncbi:MAG: TetR/AcrR family transcriptional regulator [Gemmatimonadaceae bacterium]|jgi:AcrR family transcriptional regulator|nr:TetR/AcrR family transcriptional regulator [Gemmatimonadaceae bacterium]
MDVREKILEAAVAAYSEYGFGATTRRVADLAGVNEVTLFRHFGSKSALMDEALEWFLTRLSRADDQLPELPVAPAEELYRWARGLHDRLFAARHFLRRAMGAIETRQHEAAEAMKASMCAEQDLERYVAALEAHHWFGTIPVTAEDRPAYVSAAQGMLFGGLFGDALWRDLMPADVFPFDVDTSVRQTVRVFCVALALRDPSHHAALLATGTTVADVAVPSSSPLS